MGNMRQMQMETQRADYTVLVSKKGKVTIKSKIKKGGKKKIDMSHDRKKKYVLEEGVPVPFLQDLGVMTQDGKIVRAKSDKFRQINRFLEFIEDILPELDKGRELTILDFGCGKSYLTFAMYYYLHELKEYDIRIIGLDLKKEVICHCNELSEKYGYEKLRFLEGDIADYTGVNKVDMVVTLHACDTATDYALAKAVGWDAKVILSVPCCQHELNRQIRNEVLEPVLRYELIGEGKIKPALIIGVPVGFVNVVQSKELIMQTNIPYIVARGRKGGSNIAACICNALLYMMDQDRGY